MTESSARFRYCPRRPVGSKTVDVIVSAKKPIEIYVEKVMEEIIEKQKSKIVIRGTGQVCGRIAERVAKYALRRLPPNHGFRYKIDIAADSDVAQDTQEFLLEFDPDSGRDVLRSVPKKTAEVPRCRVDVLEWLSSKTIGGQNRRQPRLKVSSGAIKRLGTSPRAGWIFKTDVENSSDFAGLPPVLCNVTSEDSARSSPMAVALVDPKKTVVYGKIIDIDPYCIFDNRFIVHTIEKALHRRERYFANDSIGNSMSYRLFHGEADGIPGLYIDKFVGSPCPAVVMHLSHVGLEGYLFSFIKAIEKVHCTAEPTTALFVRCDSSAGKPAYTELIRPSSLGHDSAGDSRNVIINEDGVLMVVDITNEPDRSALRKLVATTAACASTPFSILDLYSSSGSYGIQLLQSANAKATATCVDQDSELLRLGELSCEENAIRKGKIRFVHGRVAPFLETLPHNSLYNVIVIDPPSIADKTERKSKNAKLHSIETVVKKAAGHLAPRGLLYVTNGDNAGISSGQLAGAVGRALAAAERPRATVIARGFPDYRDHPVPLALHDSGGFCSLTLEVE
ncbi:Lysophosphatidylcholine acyltransferase 2 [Perkinsus chesapeaki]|uniref:Lysophosphatidylcholine acyltransferase 2 n=1 Tax=Perkinsus chesapeaki TaxID=330153 RepID=A0A7J6N266_PERCH|nr:Lysophosphatidylcholine acyltransferase 2 [Perkinsus chesapeaki]